MRKAQRFLYLLAASLLSAGVMSLQAQEREGGRTRSNRGERPPGGERMPPPMPVLKALDANGDGEISAEEIANASKALLTLDKNGDGKLSGDEMRAPRPEGGQRAGGGREGDRSSRRSGGDNPSGKRETKRSSPEGDEKK